MANFRGNSVQDKIYQSMRIAAEGLLNEKGMSAIDVGSNGHFPYNYMSSENFLLRETWDYLNRTMVWHKGEGNPAAPGEPHAAFGGPLSNLYDSYLNSLGYKFSSEDQARKSEYTIKVQQKGQDLVAQYEQIYGTITDLTASGQTTKLDYILSYKLTQWAGVKGIRLTEEVIQNLSDHLPNRPYSADQLLPLISDYLGALVPILGLLNKQLNASFTLTRLKRNTEHPSTDNGGVVTSDKVTRVGFGIREKMSQIDAALANPKNSVEVKLKINKYRRQEADLDINGEAGGTIPLFDLFSIGVGGSAHYSLYDLNEEGSTCDVKVIFRGVNAVHLGPTDYQEDTGTGWFTLNPIQEAIKNHGKDVSSWVLDPYPTDDGIGVLRYLAISQLPELQLNYTSGKVSEHVRKLEQQSGLEVSFLGIPLVDTRQRYSSTKIEEHEENNGYSITFKPPAPSGSAWDQRAQVLGGGIDEVSPQSPNSR
ncbi:hypothetical protein AB0I10_28160 [Streptomyces sp. NPDC050636]|uniref:hypothetical protein n=1 Tax=Streptomyces sp. NPDC050636 TaxID=3154510 RepID=UPI00343896D6